MLVFKDFLILIIMLIIKNSIYLGVLSFLYMINANNYMYFLVLFKIFISNYNYVKDIILEYDYLNQMRVIIFLIKYMDIFYKMYINIVISCFNFLFTFIKKMTLNEVIPTKEFKSREEINNFLDSL